MNDLRELMQSKVLNSTYDSDDLKSGNSKARAERPSREIPPRLGSIFHEHWWLTAVTKGRFDEVSIKNGDQLVGRLPYVKTKQMGLTLLGMPPLTHLMGPAVDGGAGKPQTQMLRRISLIRSLIDQLPRFDHFAQVLGDVSIDALPFQDRGFQVSPQYTFEVDCRVDPKELWSAMHFKTRQHIRRASEKMSVVTVEDPDAFARFYQHNLDTQGRRRRSSVSLEVFPAVFAETQARDCGEILSAQWPDGKSAAMIFLVWDDQTMYYLLSTRAHEAGDNGSVNLLLWTAINRAHARGLIFDLDGVSTSGTSRFLSGFGGRPKFRMIVQRSRFIHGAIRFAKQQITRARSGDSSAFI
jgi:hypothetical protein